MQKTTTKSKTTSDKTSMEDSIMKTFIDEYIEQGMKKGEKEGMQQGMQQGIQQGMQQGMQQGGYKILSTQLTHRFGDLPKWASEKIDNADIETIEKWSLRLLSANKLDEVFH